ncbi:MAG: hypothetical protein MH252_00675 [Thermosynechococcaceae cyanobacterium MS004]|nr:hypothetical protein [Thermosynechococcaceae cyanobacterium MS004]
MSKAVQVEPKESRSMLISALGLGVLRRWWLVSLVLLGCGAASGALGIMLLLRQPPKPQCDRVFWPFASGSRRLYCAQEVAQKRTLEDLFKAIALVDGLSRNHPLRPLINRWVEVWSKQALDLAEEEFDQGNLERAIYFAKKIPAQTTAYALVSERIAYWEKVWAKGEGIFKRAEAALNAEDWRGTFSIMIRLLTVDNRYWSVNQYEALNQRIIQAQKDETQLVEAQRFLRAGGLDNLTKALSILQDLSSKGTIFQKSVQQSVSKVARALVSIAENALAQEDLNTALNALEQIPKEVSFWPEVQDWTEIAQAMAETWSETPEGYESAIARLKKVSPNRPLYGKVQDYILRWSADIGYVRLLSEAQAQAADGSVGGLSRAIFQAQQVPSDSTQWNEAQQSIRQWSESLSDQQDRPILTQADETSFRGDLASLRAAIRQAQQIPSGSRLYAEAQSRIRDWQSQIQFQTQSQTQGFTIAAAPSASSAAPIQGSAQPISSSTDPSGDLLREAQAQAQQDTPSALAAAIETANQISPRSPQRAEAQRVINTWGNQLLGLAIRQATIDKNEAIAIAQQIPNFSSAYDAAQKQIQAWQGLP